PVHLIIQYTYCGFMLIDDSLKGYNILNEICRYRINWVDPHHDPESRRPSKETIELYSLTEYRQTVETFHRIRNIVQESMMKPEWTRMIGLDDVLICFLTNLK